MPIEEKIAKNTKSVYLQILYTNSEPILFENNDWFVLFAKRPCKEGHLLIIPKLQKPKFYELPPNVLHEGFTLATLLCKVLNQIYKPPQVVLFVKGFTNNEHAHIHVTPAYQSEDIDKDLSRPELTIDQMNQLAQKIKPRIHQALNHLS